MKTLGIIAAVLLAVIVIAAAVLLCAILILALGELDDPNSLV